MSNYRFRTRLVEQIKNDPTGVSLIADRFVYHWTNFAWDPLHAFSSQLVSPTKLSPAAYHAAIFVRQRATYINNRIDHDRKSWTRILPPD